MAIVGGHVRGPSKVAFGGRTATEAVYRLTGPDEKPGDVAGSSADAVMPAVVFAIESRHAPDSEEHLSRHRRCTGWSAVNMAIITAGPMVPATRRRRHVRYGQFAENLKLRSHQLHRTLAGSRLGHACRSMGYRKAGGQPQDDFRTRHRCIFSSGRHHDGVDVWGTVVVQRIRSGWGLPASGVPWRLAGRSEERYPNDASGRTASRINGFRPPPCCFWSLSRSCPRTDRITSPCSPNLRPAIRPRHAAATVHRRHRMA